MDTVPEFTQDGMDLDNFATGHSVLQDRPSGIFEYRDNGPLSLSACNAQSSLPSMRSFCCMPVGSSIFTIGISTTTFNFWVSKFFFFATPKTGDQCSLSHQTNTLICPQPYMPCHIFSDRLVVLYFCSLLY